MFSDATNFVLWTVLVYRNVDILTNPYLSVQFLMSSEASCTAYRPILLLFAPLL